MGWGLHRWLFGGSVTGIMSFAVLATWSAPSGTCRIPKAVPAPAPSGLGPAVCPSAGQPCVCLVHLQHLKRSVETLLLPQPCSTRPRAPAPQPCELLL